MKKALMLVTGTLLAFTSVFARADHGDGGGQGNNGQGHQNVSTSPGNDRAGEHGNPLAREDEDLDDRSFLLFGSMVGVDGSFVGSDAIRGVMGAGLPWMVDKARGALSANGHLRINVRGLVFTNDSSVPAVQRGINTEATFRGSVSCLSEKSGGGGIVTVNVMTDPFPATTDGNSEINGSVALPAQCIAPIVFVTNGAGDRWFAVIGSEVTGP